MSHFIYFAYGSNMLTQRLQARCASAKPLGVAAVLNHAIIFSKRSKDGSGKAMIHPAPGESAHGVLFEILVRERGDLDEAEGLGIGYWRSDRFEVACGHTGSAIQVSTYIALPAVVDPTLQPYDWYHALVCAGARQHALPAAYVQRLTGTPFIVDRTLDRSSRLEALRILDAAGDPDELAYPERLQS